MEQPIIEQGNDQPKPVVETELDRLRRDMLRSDKEKFELLVEMFRRNALLRKAKITHKP